MPDRRRRGLLISIVEGASATAHTSITGLGAGVNAVTIGFALLLGADDRALGWLTALSVLGGAFQLVGAALSPRLAWRKPVVIGAATIARCIWPAIGAIPFVFAERRDLGLAVFLVVWGISNALLSLGGNLWVSWMADLCPTGVRGRYFSRRSLFSGIVSVAAALTVSPALDRWFGGVPRRGGAPADAALQAKGFAVVFAIAGVFGLLCALLLRLQPEPERRGLRPEPLAARWLLAPFLDRGFRPLLLFVAVFGCANGLSLPFWAVFQLENMQLPYTYVNGYMVLLAGTMTVVGLSFWGKLSDRFGNRPIIAATIVLIVSHPFYYVIASSPSRWPLMLCDAASSGLAWSGYQMAIFNLVLALSPHARRELYFGAYAMVYGTTMAVMAVVAGRIVGDLPRSLDLLGLSLDPRQQIFLVTSLSRLGCLVFFLAAVKEPHSRPLRAIVAAASSFAKARLDAMKLMPRD